MAIFLVCLLAFVLLILVLATISFRNSLHTMKEEIKQKKVNVDNSKNKYFTVLKSTLNMSKDSSQIEKDFYQGAYSSNDALKMLLNVPQMNDSYRNSAMIVCKLLDEYQNNIKISGINKGNSLSIAT